MRAIIFRSTAVIAILALALAITINTHAVSSLPAAWVPSGTSPQDALDVACNWESLSPASDVWYRWWPRADKSLRISLVSDPRTLNGMEFRVYAPQLDSAGRDLLSGPIGYGREGNLRIAQEWQAVAGNAGDFYLNVFNHSPVSAEYSLCDSH